ncbi:class I SAM-dependent methyltransferase [Symbioplanes lichenis]|uniref:class I SAM-dependent methyltransferase n=1 Tax=Symbioplanes lichenis TaxID=1629072 RepID=UPI002738601D|nr:class I SAM-dependent methyltransferase [Actinoplanes lichenis]
MSAYTAAAWQESWDRQQEGYLPDREQRFTAMLDAVGAVTESGAPRVLDLAGGTGTISLRTLARFPRATTTVLDQDPVLLALARASLAEDSRATVVSADLGSPAWVEALPHTGFDAVLTATALHWLPGERVAALYAEIRSVLRPGGIFVNADYMPEESLPGLTKLLVARADAERAARQATGAALDWTAWWARVAGDEELAPLLAERERIYPGGSHTEWNPPAAWHLQALRDGGFSETGILWRGGADAAVIGLR